MNLYRTILLDNKVIYSVSKIEDIDIYFPNKTSDLKAFLTLEEIKRADILYARLIKNNFLLLIQPDNDYLIKQLINEGYSKTCFLSVFKDDWDKLPNYFKNDYKLLNKNEVLQSFLN